MKENNMSETTSERVKKLQMIHLTSSDIGGRVFDASRIMIEDLELQIKAKDEQLSNSMAGDEHIFLCAEIDELKKSQQTSTKASIMLADNVLRLTSQIQDLESQLSQLKEENEELKRKLERCK